MTSRLESLTRSAQALGERLARPRLAGGQVHVVDLARGAVPFGLGLAGSLGLPARGAVPSFVTWALTERCPLKCSHCDMGVAAPELNRVQRLDIAHELAESDVWGVSLIGGEVTLLPDLADLATLLSHAGKHVSVGSSGFGLSRHLDPLIAGGLANLTLSCDSHCAEGHDSFRGRPGLFDEVVALTDRAMAAPNRPAVQVRATIHRGNFEQLERLLDFWRPRVDQVLLQVIQDNGIHAVRDTSVLFQPDDRPAFEGAMARVLHSYPDLRGSYLEKASRYLFEPEQLYKDIGFRCLLVPAASVTVLPNGEVKLCYGRDDSRVGRLGEERLSDIWQRMETVATTRRMQSSSYGCMCWEQACSGNLDLLAGRRALDRVRGLLSAGNDSSVA